MLCMTGDTEASNFPNLHKFETKIHFLEFQSFELFSMSHKFQTSDWSQFSAELFLRSTQP